MWLLAFLGAVSLLTSVYGSVIVYTQDTPHSIVQDFWDMPASFGPDLPSEGLRGLLVAGNPPDGCSALDKAPDVDNFTGKWVVIVARYNCSFEVKVRNAQLAGYDCAVVHNVNSSDLENMSAKNADDIIIPSVFVNSDAGAELSKLYIYTSGFYIMVNGDMPFNINTHLLLPFAIVVVLCLLIILIFMIVKCIKDRRRARRHRLPNRALKKIPTCKFCKGDPYDTCAICLDDYQEGERLRVLPCAHAYHAVCIDPWLTQNKRVCPVCKRRVFAAGERRTRTPHPPHHHDDSDSDDDTEPLLADRVLADGPQSGGTFDEQQENPFRRAARFMSRLRARHEGNHDGDTRDQTEHIQDDNGNSDTAPLIGGAPPSPPPPSAVPALTGAVSERRRGSGRTRRPRAHSAGGGGGGPSVATPLLHSDTHSINNDTYTHTQGEIGVAALPAPQASSTPHHIDL